MSGSSSSCTYRSDDLHRRHALMPLLGELERGDRVERLDLATLRARRAPRAAHLHPWRDTGAGPRRFAPRALRWPAVLRRGAHRGLRAERRAPCRPRCATSSGSDWQRCRARHRSSSARRRSSAGASRTRAWPRHSTGMRTRLMAALRDAIDGRILVSSDGADEPGYAFRHALLREAALEELLPAERVRLHARIVGSPRGVDPRRPPRRTHRSSPISPCTPTRRATNRARWKGRSTHSGRSWRRRPTARPSVMQNERSSCGRAWTTRLRASGWIMPDLLILASQSASATRQPERAVLLAQEATRGAAARRASGSAGEAPCRPVHDRLGGGGLPRPATQRSKRRSRWSRTPGRAR